MLLDFKAIDTHHKKLKTMANHFPFNYSLMAMRAVFSGVYIFLPENGFG
jgi:hypothetical protein